ncbi:LOW QUALITY PROTEIN: PR domain zinc finger protein 15-like [Acanthaster planci]|uniref:LOW QUALITY PROTEIN: PR domain zinc finger protein 15-like n=1 Tax=Acanthaster planci TaxID=133434 RepID=A0A8B7ZDZ8_ACAPL|nr:LOW QUALITY PROTEIN: PR domain zinc finger protein 15-like [Acanthaster planci]
METEGGNQQDQGSEDLELLWCIDCEKCHGPECPLQQGSAPILISDTPTISRAVASLPGILDLRTISGTRQVIANDSIARKTVFGPLEALETSCDGQDEGFVLKVFKKDGAVVKLDTSDEQRCNWMTLVTAATTTANQNLIVYPFQGALYFTVIKDIRTGEVLRVWYAPNYAAKLGQPLLNDTCTSKPLDETPTAGASSAEDTGVNALSDISTTLSSTDASTLVSKSAIASAGAEDTSISTPWRAQRRIVTRSNARAQLASGSSRRRQNRAKKRGPVSKKPKASRPSKSKSVKDVDAAGNDDEDDEEFDEADEESEEEEMVPFTTLSMRGRPVKRKYVVSTLLGKGKKAKMITTSRVQSQSSGDITGEKQARKVVKKHSRNTTSWRRSAKQQEHPSQPGRRTASSPNLPRESGRILTCLRKSTDKSRNASGMRASGPATVARRCLMTAPRWEHLLSEHQQEPIPCPDCKKFVLTSEQLAEHTAAIHREPPDASVDDAPTYKCPLCDKQLLHRRTFHNHLEFVHSKTFRCDTCGGQFWNRSKFLQHVGEHRLQGENVNAEEMYTCDKCKREFTCLSGLSIHKAFAHKEKSFSCSHCDYTTRYELTLQEHILFSHPENDLGIPESQKLRCEVCDAVFLRTRTLKHHMMNHKKREFKCNKCDAVYRRKETLLHHNCLTARRRTVALDVVDLTEPTAGTCNMFECQQCNKMFANQASLKHHAKTHQDKNYTCSVCNKEFHKRFNFDLHKYQHLRVATSEDGSRELIQVGEESVEKHNCHLCEVHFTKMNPLIQHLQSYHSSAIPEVYVCTPCQRLFLSREELSAHVANHTRITLPKGVTLDSLHSCPICGRVFKAAGSLTSHMSLHTGDKNHICEVCGKTFRRADSLKSHRLARHDTNSKMYKCNICDKSFKSNCLRGHIQFHTGQRDYQCPHCNRTFSQRGNFNRHVVLHGKKKQYKCPNCDRVFKHEEYLERHQLVHGSYDFVCTTCGGKFSTQHFLTNHIRKVHEAEEACQCEYCGMKFKYLQSYRSHMHRKHPEVNRSNYRPVTEYSADVQTLEGIVSSLITVSEDTGEEGTTTEVQQMQE